MNIIPFFISGNFRSNGDINFTRSVYMSSHRSLMYKDGCDQLAALLRSYERHVPTRQAEEVVNRWFGSEGYLYQQVKKLGNILNKTDHLEYRLLETVGNTQSIPHWFSNRNARTFHHMGVVIADDLNRLNNQIYRKQTDGHFNLGDFDGDLNLPLILAYEEVFDFEYAPHYYADGKPRLNTNLFKHRVITTIIQELELYEDVDSFFYRNNYRGRLPDAYETLHHTDWYQRPQEIPKSRNLNPQSTGRMCGERGRTPPFAMVGPQPDHWSTRRVAASGTRSPRVGRSNFTPELATQWVTSSVPSEDSVRSGN